MDMAAAGLRRNVGVLGPLGAVTALTAFAALARRVQGLGVASAVGRWSAKDRRVFFLFG